MNKNKAIFCQLALANFRKQLNFKIDEKSIKFDYNEIETFSGDATISFIDTKFSVFFKFKYDVEKILAKFKGSYLQPPDQDEFILDYIYIENIDLIEDDNVNSIEISHDTELLAEYLVGLILEQELDADCNKYILNHKQKIQKLFKNTILDLSYLKENYSNKLKKIINEVLEELKFDNKQRYVVTMDFYIYEKDDEAAIKLAKQIVKKEEMRYDNAASLISVHKQPFGVLDSKLIWGGKND